MCPELKSSVRHLFDAPDVSFNILLTAARHNELEETDGKATKAQTKASVVEKEKLSPRTESLNELKDQVKKLATVMKAGTFPKRNNPPADKRSKGNGNNGQNQNRNNNLQRHNGSRTQDRNGDNVRNNLTGPAANASGPFTDGQRPIQCYKCKGWGHPHRICPSKGNLNFSRRGTRVRLKPLPQTRVRWNPQTTIKNKISNMESSASSSTIPQS